MFQLCNLVRGDLGLPPPFVVHVPPCSPLSSSSSDHRLLLIALLRPALPRNSVEFLEPYPLCAPSHRCILALGLTNRQNSRLGKRKGIGKEKISYIERSSPSSNLESDIAKTTWKLGTLDCGDKGTSGWFWSVAWYVFKLNGHFNSAQHIDFHTLKPWWYIIPPPHNRPHNHDCWRKGDEDADNGNDGLDRQCHWTGVLVESRFDRVNSRLSGWKKRERFEAAAAIHISCWEKRPFYIWYAFASMQLAGRDKDWERLWQEPITTYPALEFLGSCWYVVECSWCVRFWQYLVRAIWRCWGGQVWDRCSDFGKMQWEAILQQVLEKPNHHLSFLL